MPRGGAAAKPAAKKGPKAHKLAAEFPKGLLLTDVFKKEWQLGEVIGQGGFGLIYLASKHDSTSKPVTKANAENVIKIEPKDNGPLYCEINFYQRAAKETDLKEFITKHKLHYLSVPPYIASGIYAYQSKDYRFLVMPRLGTDLQHLLKDHGGTFPPQAVFAVGLRMVDALEYMHEKSFVHADIKAGNILMGFKNGKVEKDQVYLVDFGLAAKYKDDNAHKPYKEDPRRAHDGTIEFTSRDAHKGLAPSRRGDIEILGYCLLQWLCGRLPWESNLSDPNSVAFSKEKNMKQLPEFIESCFANANSAVSVHKTIIQSFLSEVNKLQYDTEPDYNKLKSILKTGLSKAGQKNEWLIDFTSSKTKTPTKRKSGGAGDMSLPSPEKKARIATPKKKAAKVPSPKRKTSAADDISSPSPKKKARTLSPKKKLPVQKHKLSAAKSPTPLTAARSPKKKPSTAKSPTPLTAARSPKKKPLVAKSPTPLTAARSPKKKPLAAKSPTPLTAARSPKKKTLAAKSPTPLTAARSPKKKASSAASRIKSPKPVPRTPLTNGQFTTASKSPKGGKVNGATQSLAAAKGQAAASTKRTVKRLKTVTQSDASMQTSPLPR